MLSKTVPVESMLSQAFADPLTTYEVPTVVVPSVMLLTFNVDNVLPPSFGGYD